VCEGGGSQSRCPSITCRRRDPRPAGHLSPGHLEGRQSCVAEKAKTLRCWNNKCLAMLGPPSQTGSGLSITDQVRVSITDRVRALHHRTGPGLYHRPGPGSPSQTRSGSLSQNRSGSLSQTRSGSLSQTRSGLTAPSQYQY